MSVALKPPIVPESISLDLRRSDRIVRSAEGGSFQREVREGQARWIADVTWPPLHGDDRRELDAWLAMIDRGDRWALIEWPFSGSGASAFHTNKIKNPDFTDNLDHWVPASNSTIRRIARRMEVIADALDTLGGGGQADISVSSSTNVIIRFTVFKGFLEDTVTFNFTIPGSGTTEFSAGNITVPDVDEITYVHRVTGTEGGNYALNLRTHDVGPAGRSMFFDSVQITEGCRVNAAGGAGNMLQIKDGPNDIIARAGDFVEIFTEGSILNDDRAQKSEFKRLTSDVHGAGGTSTHLMRFEPALRESPPQDAFVLFHRPRFKAVMTNENRQTRYTQPDYVQVTRRFEEDILA